ncbi:hypothetical protein [Hamadaea tsunoensis]|uniref:hypothetical protein n=1 Tax=Hamadaea tsunoensis TaxID=53368 RepID=UPI00041306F7|nr:hypothetical protein [Hamadaea tsunoensis]
MVDPTALASAVEKAFAADTDLDYWGAIRYAEAAGQVVETIAALVRQGEAAHAVPLFERASELLGLAQQRADDTAGCLDDLQARVRSGLDEARAFSIDR